MEFGSAVVYKDGEEVARCARGKIVEMDFEGLPHLELFHIPILKLNRIFLFEHMAGKPLGSFFNYSGVDVEGRRVEPVFYVHGRSEAIRGKTTVSAVVLAYPHGEIDPRDFLLKTPQIYKQFTTLI
jgi:hypothetical protein